MAEPFGVVELLAVDTRPRLLRAATAMVAVDAHIFCIVLAAFMWARDHLPALLLRTVAVTADIIVLTVDRLLSHLFSAPKLCYIVCGVKWLPTLWEFVRCEEIGSHLAELSWIELA